jgi:hypothetical protein
VDTADREETLREILLTLKVFIDATLVAYFILCTFSNNEQSNQTGNKTRQSSYATLAHSSSCNLPKVVGKAMNSPQKIDSKMLA